MAKDDNISLNRIFDVIQEIAERHKMIEDNDIGDVASRGSSKGQNDDTKKPRELDFPYLFTNVIAVSYEVGASRTVSAKTYQINLFVADKHSDNAKNDNEILSDTESILSDLIQYIVQNQRLREFIVGIGVTNADPARHTTIQEAYGFQAVLSIKVKASICWELLPFTDGDC